MSNPDLSMILSSIRASKGDQAAKQYILSKRIQAFDLKLEALSMSLQMQFNRLLSSNLHKLQSNSIGKEIHQIVENGLKELISIYLKDECFYKFEMHNLFEQIKSMMSVQAINVSKGIQNYNISHDFDNIVFQLKEFDYKNIICVLKCLLIINVNRRAKRRQFLSNTC